jgi:hypothetical protein
MVAISPPDDPDDLRRVRVLGDDGVPFPGVKVPVLPDATLLRVFDDHHG